MANRPKRLDPTILTIDDLRISAEKKADRVNADYFAGGSGDLVTLRDNEEAYNRYKLRPRVLRDVENIDISTTIFGQKVAFPMGFAPTAAHKLAHPEGENATSKAAATNDIPMCLSSWSTTTLEDVSSHGKGNPYIIQVSLLKDENVAKRIIRRAEAAGYKAMFLTVDLPVLGARLNEARNNFSYPTHLTFPNLSKRPGDEDTESIEDGAAYDKTINWAETIPWLRKQTKMEIWLKGIYTPEDVEESIRHGVDGVVISNHGGRQLDGVPSTLDALRECAPVAAGRISIAIDGGIRRGSDIFKALALGAQFCFVGRIPIWGLMHDGEKGADLGVKLVMEELRSVMALTGCKKIGDINKTHLSFLGPNGVLAKL